LMTPGGKPASLIKLAAMSAEIASVDYKCLNVQSMI